MSPIVPCEPVAPFCPLAPSVPSVPCVPVGPVAPWDPVGPVVPCVPVVPCNDKFVLERIFPDPSATKIAVSVVPDGVPVNCKVFNEALEPLTINFFQFGIFFSLLWLVTLRAHFREGL